MSAELKDLGALAQKNADGLANLTKTVTGIAEKMARTPANGQPHPHQVFGAPWVRHGEDPMSSRGFSFLKLLGLITGDSSAETAKVELDVCSRLHNIYVKEMGGSGYAPGGGGAWHMPQGKFLAPLATDYMTDSMVPYQFRQEMKQLVNAGTGGASRDEMRYIAKNLLGTSWHQKALSWLNETTGGALVAPPEMGELIELLRNKEALVNAGARTVPLPPQGRLKYPRQTSASTAYWVGENKGITESLVGTGDVNLQAKKLAVLIKAPNELIRFASPAAEALLRDDMTKTLALALDLAGLEGTGSDYQPRGLINFQNINRLTSTSAAANGDQLTGVDIYRMIAAVEESNAEFESYIMRPKTLYKYYQLRSDAVAQGDAAGPFLFNLIRESAEGVNATLAGYPVVKSTQISQSRAKGTATNLTYVAGGMWSDLLIGMFGAIEFAATTLGDTAFTNDQTWVRGILSADIQARHEAAFVILDNLDTTL